MNKDIAKNWLHKLAEGLSGNNDDINMGQDVIDTLGLSVEIDQSSGFFVYLKIVPEWFALISNNPWCTSSAVDELKADFLEPDSRATLIRELKRIIESSPTPEDTVISIVFDVSAGQAYLDVWYNELTALTRPKGEPIPAFSVEFTGE